MSQVSQTTQKHEDSMKVEMSVYPAAEIQWKDGPASLPGGCMRSIGSSAHMLFAGVQEGRIYAYELAARP